MSSITAVFVRLRWFTLGALTSLGALSYLAVQVKRARERLSPAALARSGGRSVAGLLDRAAEVVAPVDHHRR